MGGTNSGKKAKRRKVTVTFTAYPEDVRRWVLQSKAEDRSLSQWLYMRLLAADELGARVVQSSQAKAESQS